MLPSSFSGRVRAAAATLTDATIASTLEARVEFLRARGVSASEVLTAAAREGLVLPEAVRASLERDLDDGPPAASGAAAPLGLPDGDGIGGQSGGLERRFSALGLFVRPGGKASLHFRNDLLLEERTRCLIVSFTRRELLCEALGNNRVHYRFDPGGAEYLFGLAFKLWFRHPHGNNRGQAGDNAPVRTPTVRASNSIADLRIAIM
jgi:hypothetical protein